MTDWHENHAVISSLSDEEAARQEDLTNRVYLDVALFWGPNWLEYKSKGGSFEALTQEKANQKARLYLGRDNSRPIFVFEGKAPRYVGSEGIRVLAQHGVPVSLATTQETANSDNSKWLVAAVASILLFAGMMLIAIRMVVHAVHKKPQPTVMSNVAEQR